MPLGLQLTIIFLINYLCKQFLKKCKQKYEKKINQCPNKKKKN